MPDPGLPDGLKKLNDAVDAQGDALEKLRDTVNGGNQWPLQPWFRWVLLIFVVIILLTIWLWPQRSGDVKDIDGRRHIYWRGPDPAKPGEWLPEVVDPSKLVSVTTDGKAPSVVASHAWDLPMKVVDRIWLGKRWLIVLENGEASFWPPEAAGP